MDLTKGWRTEVMLISVEQLGTVNEEWIWHINREYYTNSGRQRKDVPFKFNVLKRQELGLWLIILT